jgi:hypothetical protein
LFLSGDSCTITLSALRREPRPEGLGYFDFANADEIPEPAIPRPSAAIFRGEIS